MSPNDRYDIGKAIADSYEQQCRETGSFSTGGLIDAIEAAGFRITRRRVAKNTDSPPPMGEMVK